MATLPRPSVRYPPRPISAFDAGINASAAWTESLEDGFTGPKPALDIDKQRAYRKALSESNAKLESSAQVSTEEDDADEAEPLPMPARALYAFHGKPEFRELNMEAGDELEIVKEDVGSGWSLARLVPKLEYGSPSSVRTTGAETEVGLVPKSYYALTTELILSPGLQLDLPPTGLTRDASQSSITPRGSPRHTHIDSDPNKETPPIIPQSTGEWFSYLPSFRASLLGGKSLNRFSRFVTSGAEAYVLHGPTEPDGLPSVSTDASPIKKHTREETTQSVLESREEERNRLGLGEADKHYIDTSLHGPRWKSKTAPFNILVHSPLKKTEGIGGTHAYTLYSVTSLFPKSTECMEPPAGWVDVEDMEGSKLKSEEEETGTRITVFRRFSHFVLLHTALHRRLPGIALPCLPEKQYAGRFSDAFVEARRGDLERYLNKLVKHPVVRYAEVVVLFLGCEDDATFTKSLNRFVSAPAVGPQFYARVYHPAFNVDAEDADGAYTSFQSHVKAVGKCIQGLRNVFGHVRQARIEMSKAERLLSFSLLSLITSTPLSSAPATGTRVEDEDIGVQAKGLMNSDGAWCWREGCDECLSLTKAVQKTCETMQTVANLYDGHARRTQLATHESLKLMAHPSSQYEGVVTTHKSSLSRYREATVGGRGANYMTEHIASRCETVLNTTMAEMDFYHQQKTSDIKTIVTEHLDGEIALYEQILARLKNARKGLTPEGLSSFDDQPRVPGLYERDLGAISGLNERELEMPCPHVYDAAPMRPVGVAIQEGVGMFLRGGGEEQTRGSSGFRLW